MLCQDKYFLSQELVLGGVLDACIFVLIQHVLHVFLVRPEKKQTAGTVKWHYFQKLKKLKGPFYRLCWMTCTTTKLEMIH